MVDYSKWQNFADDAESDDERDSKPAHKDATAAGELGRTLLGKWLREGQENTTESDIARLIAFVELLQPRTAAQFIRAHSMVQGNELHDNRSQAEAITADLEQHGMPSIRSLLLAVANGTARSHADLDASRRGPAVRVEGSMRVALNTLLACRAAGSARALFERMRNEASDGKLTRHYVAGGFEAAALDEHFAATNQASLDALKRASLEVPAVSGGARARGGSGSSTVSSPSRHRCSPAWWALIYMLPLIGMGAMAAWTGVIDPSVLGPGST